MPEAKSQTPVSSKQESKTVTAPLANMPKVKGIRDLPETTKNIDLTYRITYRSPNPNSEYTFTKDFNYNGPLELILRQVRYEMGHYGGLKAEAIGGDLHEITNGKD